jgi:hypothetical protein
VSVLGDHSCALTGGSWYCWKRNVDGQLGDGTYTSHSRPVVLPSGFAQIRAGVYRRRKGVLLGVQRLAPTSGHEIRTLPVAVVGGNVFKARSAGAQHARRGRKVTTLIHRWEPTACEALTLVSTGCSCS